ncbi:MAG: hypothetical protein UU01_C0002G0020 [Parcubacteria group bacterium GW2011_GWA2_40_37]|nr:MAG: hypothetical protein UU01_C0002G0020 [Parcubacteria group bacterium GW2011_GWA2_40_37]
MYQYIFAAIAQVKGFKNIINKRTAKVMAGLFFSLIAKISA